MPCKRKTETKILRNAAQTKNLSNKLLSNPQDSTETQGKMLLEHMNERKKKPVANIKNISAFFRYNFLQLSFHFNMQTSLSITRILTLNHQLNQKLHLVAELKQRLS